MPKRVPKKPVKPESKTVPRVSAGGKRATKGSRGRRVTNQIATAGDHLLEDLRNFLSPYIYTTDETFVLVLATWSLAAWVIDSFDRFPHLAITSPERRCGKTTILDLLERITPNGQNAVNMRPATVWRLVAQAHPTILFDEAQCLSRTGHEDLMELFCNVDRDKKVPRCVGTEHEIKWFDIYCPKVLALIGQLHGVLADRCLPIRMERKPSSEKTKRVVKRNLIQEAEPFETRLNEWSEKHRDEVSDIYANIIEPFEIDNDRLADLLLPLQTILHIEQPDYIPLLEQYAQTVVGREKDKMSDGVLLLAALMDIFNQKDQDFLSTEHIIRQLEMRDEDPWAQYSRGKPIHPTQVAILLKPYEIKPEKKQRKIRGTNVTTRGYYKQDFEKAWKAYLPALG